MRTKNILAFAATSLLSISAWAGPATLYLGSNSQAEAITVPESVRLTNSDTAAVFYTVGTNLEMNCTMWLPGFGGFEVVSNRFANLHPATFVYEKVWNTFQIRDSTGHVFFQKIQMGPGQFAIFGMFRVQDATRHGVFVAEPAGNRFVPMSDDDAIEALKYGLKLTLAK